MKLCGLTGGVGMGKSTAAGFFLQQGARVIDTDELAHHLVQPGRPALDEIRQSFGETVLAADGSLRRDVLARIVFSSPASRQQLEAILHPRIREAWLSQVEILKQEKHCQVALVIIPLLFETRAESHFEKIICVACSLKAQHQRLTGRGWSAEQISQRIAAQLPIGEKIARSQFVLWSEGELAVLGQQVSRVFKRI